jgi:adenosylmethionine-8-amino-7-oxononanoate aminotransferase
LPIIDRGEGIYLFDKSGKRYIDGSSGALVCSVGHGQDEIVDFIHKETKKVAYVNGNYFHSDLCENLASKLCGRSPGRLDRAFFLCSGSEAIEAAIKFARQYFFDRGLEKKYKVIARSPGYHGNTLYALSASGRPRYKKYFGPLLSEVCMVRTPYEYRSPSEDYEGEACEIYLKEIEDLILKEGAHTIACVLVEPVSGTSTAGSCPPKNYLRSLQELCRKNDILIIADEVLCGAGRTGSFYASEQEFFEPDLLVLGKGVNGGYAPLSVLLTRTDLVDVIAKNSLNYMHAQTYVNTPSSLAAGVAVVDFMDRYRVIEKSRTVGAYFLSELKKLESYEGVGHAGGRGMFGGLELVENKASKTPLSRSFKASESLMEILFSKGLVAWNNSGQIDGEKGDLLVLGPPLITTLEQIDEMIEVLKSGLEDWIVKMKKLGVRFS